MKQILSKKSYAYNIKYRAMHIIRGIFNKYKNMIYKVKMRVEYIDKDYYYRRNIIVYIIFNRLGPFLQDRIEME